MIHRQIHTLLNERLAFYPGMVLQGPRQVGKTTLARAIAAQHPEALVLDLERPADRAQLAEPELFLAQHRHRLVVMDEVQMLPDVFAHLRPEMDAHRRPGRFLLLGSASGALLRQRSESLAGRVGYLELTPLLASEVTATPHDLGALQHLWLRGGFPLAHLAPSERLAYAWRQDFIQTFLQRDLPQMGVSVGADVLHRFWRMLAHLQGQLFNASQLGQSLGGVSHVTTARYLDLLVDTLLVRRLEPHLPNVGKRLIKSPKTYIRDSGLLHALLHITSLHDLQGHPIVGASWEGFVLEQVAAHLPEGAQLGFYRTAAGAEMDVVVQAGSRSVAIEVKFSSAPKVTKGFWLARDDLKPTHTVVVAPVERRFPLKDGVEVVPVSALPELMAVLA